MSVPDLSFSDPDCTVCDTETANDGTSRWCEGCGATWAIDGTDGEPGAADTPRRDQ